LGGSLGDFSASRLNQDEVIERKQFSKRQQRLITYLSMRFLKPIVGEDMPDIKYYKKKDSHPAFTSGRDIYWNLKYVAPVFSHLETVAGNPQILSEELQASESPVRKFLEDLVHESQHLPQFEEAGDHTHHEAQAIDGFDAKDDKRFGVRMGRAFDELLFDLPEDLTTIFSATPEQMEGYIKSNVRKQDKAMINTQPKKALVKARVANKETGGIDLTPANMDLQTQNNGGEIKFHLNPAQLAQLQNAPGFVPVIINIQPINNLRVFLGL
jgi:hypothetical protein